MMIRFKTNGGLKAAAGSLSDLAGLHSVVGEAIAKQARANAVAMGGRKFWHRVADSTRLSEATPERAVVSSSHVAAAQKQFGGDISAPGKGPNSRNARRLAIPVDEQARSQGRDPAYYARSHQLEVVVSKRAKGKDQALLGYTAGQGKNRKFRPLFVLVKRVSQRAYPWFPMAGDAAAIATSEAARFLKLRSAR